MLRDYGLLRDDLLTLIPDRRAAVVLIKANVRRVLEPKLVADGFRVLNNGRSIYFPSHGNQNRFHGQFAEVVAELS